MVKEKLIAFIIRNCDQGNFRDMWWHDEPKGVFCLNWTRQGNKGWIPPEAAIEWSRQKRHVKDKKERDFKAGLRNALLKKTEIRKFKVSKEMAEKDGRKYSFWQFKDLKSERANIINPPLKIVQTKRTVNTKKNYQKCVEDIHPSYNSTSGFEGIYKQSGKTSTKCKASGKKYTRSQMISVKRLEDDEYQEHGKFQENGEAVSPLPSISSILGKRHISQLPLQSQKISSTLHDARFPDTMEFELSGSPSFTPGGPTPPPQPNDVQFNGEYLSMDATHLNSSNYFNYPPFNQFPVSQAPIPNIPKQSYVNLMAAPQSINTTSIYQGLNMEDSAKLFAKMALENEQQVQEVSTAQISSSELAQLDEAKFDGFSAYETIDFSALLEMNLNFFDSNS